MKIRRVLVYAILLFSIFSLARAASPAYASEACGVAGFDDPLICGSETGDEESELQGRIKNTLNQVYLWIGIIAVIVVVISGIMYMTSAGNPEKVKGAKNAMTYSIIGLLVTLAAFAITNLVINAVDGIKPGDTVATPTGGGANRDEVSSISMIPATRMVVGDSAEIRAKVIPDYAKDKTLTWSSSNKEVVTVNQKGKIKAKKHGTAKITAKAKNGKKATTTVTVEKPVAVESIKVSPESVKVNKGKTANLEATISPHNAADKTVTWKSGDKSIATVDSTGKVTGKKVGKTKVTATTKNGKKATASVTVDDPTAEEAIKVTDDLIKHLDQHYNQINWPNTEVCKTQGNHTGLSIAATSCGISTYAAAHYVLTKQDVDFPAFVEESCGTGFMNGKGASWNVVAHNKKSFYDNKYNVTGKKINANWDSYVKELKKGHPIAFLVTHATCGFRSCGNYGSHFFLLLSYREKNGGEIYVWNPTNINQGWHNQSYIKQYATDVLWRGTDLPWAMYKIK